MAIMLEKGLQLGPVKRIAGFPGIIPAARSLEDASVITKDQIKQVIYEILL
jgi:hypothetical protein